MKKPTTGDVHDRMVKIPLEQRLRAAPPPAPKSLNVYEARPLTFSAFQTVNEVRCTEWHGEHPKNTWSLADWAVALAGEVGELCNVVKKLNRSRDGIRGNDVEDAELRRRLEDELADVVTYAFVLASHAELDLGEACIRKFNAVSEKHGLCTLLG